MIMNEHDLKRYRESILEHGPTRVVISSEGEATTWERAEKEYNIKPTIIFLRKDGWSLGAPEKYRSVAEKMWYDEWVGTIDVKTGLMKPFRRE